MWTRRISIVAATFVAACQPLYGAKPDRLRTPVPIAHTVTTTPILPPPYDEACQVDFRAHIKVVHRDPVAASNLVRTGDARAQTAEHTAEWLTKGDLLKQSVESYREALIKDPFDADATLKLALAYDHVLRKGCALAMLQRLAQLSTNPGLSTAADRIDEVAQTTAWFSGYRSAALAAIGH